MKSRLNKYSSQLMEDKMYQEINKNHKNILIDSNNDGVCDEWSKTGFTVENGLIVKWDDHKHKAPEFTKYVTDPYSKSSTGDPFSDVDKILGKIDKGILPEAHHPLVAAYPKISVRMERLILSKNITVSTDNTNSNSSSFTMSHGMSTQNTHSSSHSINNSVSAGFSLSDIFSFNFNATLSEGNDWSDTNAITDSFDKSNTNGKESSFHKGLNLNESDAAFLNGNLRYLNVGTAPAYYLKPTLNFVLGDGENAQTINSIVAKANTVVNVLNPDAFYPSLHQNPIAWNTMDDFDSQPIKLNYNQVLDLDNGTPLKIQTTQIAGYYKRYNLDSEVTVDETHKWEIVMNDIQSRTALITIEFNDGTIQERRISARKVKNYQTQTQPKITLGEALEIAFADLKIVNNQIIHPKLDFKFYEIVMNKLTHDIANQQKSLLKSIFDLRLTQGMNILIKKDLAKEREKSNDVPINLEKNINNQLEIILQLFRERDQKFVIDVSNMKKWVNDNHQLKILFDDFITEFQKILINQFRKHYNPQIDPSFLKDFLFFFSESKSVDKEFAEKSINNTKVTENYLVFKKDFMKVSLNTIENTEVLRLFIVNKAQSKFNKIVNLKSGSLQLILPNDFTYLSSNHASNNLVNSSLKFGYDNDTKNFDW